MPSGSSEHAVRGGTRVPFIDCHPPTDDFASEVREGLSAVPKRLPAKFLYDGNGSRLFEKICELDEYYLARTELGLIRRYGAEMAVALGPEVTVVEYGSGWRRNTQMLFERLAGLRAYVAVNHLDELLREATTGLADEYPAVATTAVRADYQTLVELPVEARCTGRKVIFFPGSTIGNLLPGDAETLLRQMAALVGRGGGCLIGIDCKKDRAVLERAYNDAPGLTARFNLNLLTHLNHRLGERGCRFEHAHFRHHAYYNESQGRIEMHLVCQRPHRVWLDESVWPFAAGESIHTESSYKYHPDEFRALATRAGWQPMQFWIDEKGWFSVHYLRCR